jgi:hypothetical protein
MLLSQQNPVSYAENQGFKWVGHDTQHGQSAARLNWARHNAHLVAALSVVNWNTCVLIALSQPCARPAVTLLYS